MSLQPTKSGDSNGRFINLSLLKPGDVILTYPAGSLAETWESAGIVLSTGGPYSHAILVIEPMRWYESGDEGVGPFLVTFDRIEIGGTGGLRMLKSLDKWKHFDVFRRDGLPSDTEQFTSALQKITDQLNYKRYPSYTRIARDLQVLEWLPLRDSLASLFSDNVLPNVNRGLFCSEVVAHVYQELGLGFTNKKAEQVRPSDIAEYEISGMAKMSHEDNIYRKPDETASTVPPGVFNTIATFGGRNTVHLNTTLKTAQEFVSSLIPSIAEDMPLRFQSALDSEFHLASTLLELIIAIGKTLNTQSPNVVSTLKEAVEEFEFGLEGLELAPANLRQLAEAYRGFRNIDNALCDSLMAGLRRMFEISRSTDDVHLRSAHLLLNAFEQGDLSQLPPNVLPSVARFVEQIKELIRIFGDIKNSRFTSWLVMHPDWPLGSQSSAVHQGS